MHSICLTHTVGLICFNCKCSHILIRSTIKVLGGGKQVFQLFKKGRQDQENYSSLVFTLEADQLAPCLSIGYRYEGVNSSYGVSLKHGDE